MTNRIERNEGPKEPTYMNRSRKWGFTLVELLVVIAIISILAAIVVPRVQQHILRSRMVRSFAEVRSIETEMASMLTHANKDRFQDLFDPAPTPPQNLAEFKDQVGVYTNAFYILLRQGRTLNEDEILPLKLAPGVKEKLSTSYLPDLQQDQWGNLYQFWVGTWNVPRDTSSPDTALATAFPLRAFRAPEVSEDGLVYPWMYSVDNRTLDEDGQEVQKDRKAELDAELPGNPPVDGTFGYPAPKDLGLYVFSMGVNGRADQNFNLSSATDPSVEDELKGGGDDINNWDGEQGWTGFYT